MNKGPRTVIVIALVLVFGAGGFAFGNSFGNDAGYKAGFAEGQAEAIKAQAQVEAERAEQAKLEQVSDEILEGSNPTEDVSSDPLVATKETLNPF